MPDRQSAVDLGLGYKREAIRTGSCAVTLEANDASVEYRFAVLKQGNGERAQ
jgi:hypothetical protein